MKIVFFHRFFFPDTSATSQVLSDLAFHLAARGREVHVVTSRTPEGDAPSETVRGVAIHRVADAMTGPHNLFERGMAYARFVREARKAAVRLLSPGDVAVVKTDPPMSSAAFGKLAAKRGARVVAWLQDIFPEIAVEYGVPGMRAAAPLLKRSRDRSLQLAESVVVIGERMAAHVRSLGCVAPERLHVVHNWADGAAIVPVERARNALREEWRLQGQFVVGYSGNLGRVHEFGTILRAAARLREHPGVRFLFVGRGPRLAEVRARVAREKLGNVEFQPHQPRSRLAESLGAPDVHLSVLPPRFEGLVVPSKIYGVMAAGRPAIFVGDVTGETARILRHADAGVTVATGDADALANEIVRLQEDSPEAERLGANARAAFEARYDMPLALARWEAILGPP